MDVMDDVSMEDGNAGGCKIAYQMNNIWRKSTQRRKSNHAITPVEYSCRCDYDFFFAMLIIVLKMHISSAMSKQPRIHRPGGGGSTNRRGPKIWISGGQMVAREAYYAALTKTILILL